MKKELLRAGKIPSLDGLRAVAIVIVLWGHAGFPTLIRESTGVTIFFFLSGYLITTLMRAEADKRGEVSLKNFYLRRVLRIFPSLFIVLAAAVVLSLLGLMPNAMNAGGIASSATFLSNYFIIFEGRDGLPGGMNALWSLAVEEHYYMLFPLLYVAMRKWLPNRLNQALLLAAICFLILAWRCFLIWQGADYDRIYLATDTRADAILWGAILAIIANPVYGEIPKVRNKSILPAVLVASAAVFYLVSRAPDIIGMSLGYTVQSVVLAGVFVPLILAPESMIGRVLNWKPIAYLGVLSYSLYLVHRPLLILADEHLSLPHAVEAFVGLAAAILVAWLIRVLVERPIEGLRGALRGPGKRVATPDPQPAIR